MYQWLQGHTASIGKAIRLRCWDLIILGPPSMIWGQMTSYMLFCVHTFGLDLDKKAGNNKAARFWGGLWRGENHQVKDDPREIGITWYKSIGCSLLELQENHFWSFQKRFAQTHMVCMINANLVTHFHSLSLYHHVWRASYNSWGSQSVYPSSMQSRSPILLLGTVLSSSKLFSVVLNFGDKNAKLEHICPLEELSVCFAFRLIEFIPHRYLPSATGKNL